MSRRFEPSPDFIAEHQARVRRGRGLDNAEKLLQRATAQKRPTVRRPLKLRDEGAGFKLNVSLPLPPSVNHCYANVAGKGRVLTKRARAYKTMVSDLVAVEAMCSKFNLPDNARLGLSMMLHFGSHRRNDLDNVCKLINDSVASALGFDDSALDFLLLRRGEVDKSNPRCEIVLSVL